MIEVYTPQEIVNISTESSFDMIIAFNKDALLVVTDFASIRVIPIVYILCDIEKNLVWNHSGVIKNFIIGTSDYQLPYYILQDKDYCLVPPIFNLKGYRQKKVSRSNLEKLHLLFHVNDKLLLSLVPEINKMIYYKAIIICDNYSLFRDMFNPSIQVFKNEKVSLPEQISQTDIFIGEKSGAAHSIHVCKSTIIAGQEGYGGLISPLNIKQQAHNGFKGRIGGCIGEYIPIDLLFKDIDNCAQKNQNTAYDQILLDISDKFDKYNGNNINLITSYIADYFSLKKTEIDDKLFILNDDYLITAISGSKYLITDGRIYKFIAILSDKEYNYVKQFTTPTTFKQVLNRTDTLLPNEAENLLSDLVEDHILKALDE